MSPEKEQVTLMILNVDLKCSCCYKKVRKLLCKFPQIRDQVFDEEKNKVMITVVCCDPEKLRDKLCCKGGRAIQSIEIPPPKPPTPTPPVPKPKMDPDPPIKVKMPDPKPKPKPQPQPQPQPPPVKMPDPQPKPPDPIPQPQPVPVKMPDPKPKPQPQPVPVKMPDPIPQPQPVPVKMPEPVPMEPFCPPVSVCCQECYEGRGGGPCNYGYGRPTPPPCCQECYEGRGGGPCNYGYGRPTPPPPGPCYDYGYQYRPPCYVSRCDYLSEENPQGCSIM